MENILLVDSLSRQMIPLHLEENQDKGIIIGRGFPNDSTPEQIFLPYDIISKLHAKIYRNADNQVMIENLSQRNGTFVNGIKIQQAVALKHKDKVSFGSKEFEYTESFLTGETQEMAKPEEKIAKDWKDKVTVWVQSNPKVWQRAVVVLGVLMIAIIIWPSHSSEQLGSKANVPTVEAAKPETTSQPATTVTTTPETQSATPQPTNTPEKTSQPATAVTTPETQPTTPQPTNTPEKTLQPTTHVATPETTPAITQSTASPEVTPIVTSEATPKVEIPASKAPVVILQTTGYTTLRQQARITSSSDGKVVQILVKKGSSVEKDQVLAILDISKNSSELQAYNLEKKIVQEEIARLQEATNLAAEKAAKAQTNYEKDLISKVAMEETKKQYASLQSELESAKQKLQLAELRLVQTQEKLKDFKITATSQGIITQEFRKVGEITKAQEPIFLLAAFENTIAFFSVAKEDAKNISEKQQVLLTVPEYPEKEYNGIVVRKIVDKKQPTYIFIEVAIPNADGNIFGKKNVSAKFLAEK